MTGGDCNTAASWHQASGRRSDLCVALVKSGTPFSFYELKLKIDCTSLIQQPSVNANDSNPSGPIAKALLAAFSIALTAPACDPVHFEWQGPTPAFQVFDTNRDRSIDASEWAAVRGVMLSDWREFRLADCDENGRVSWSEYFARKFRHQECRSHTPWFASYLTSSLHTSPSFSVTTSNGRSEVAQNTTHPSNSTPRLQEVYLETDPSDIELALIRLSTATTSSPSATGSAEDETRRQFWLPCQVENQNSRFRVRLLALAVIWENDGQLHESIILTPTTIPPGSRQLLTIRFAAARACRLLWARGDRA